MIYKFGGNYHEVGDIVIHAIYGVCIVAEIFKEKHAQHHISRTYLLIDRFGDVFYLSAEYQESDLSFFSQRES